MIRTHTTQAFALVAVLVIGPALCARGQANASTSDTFAPKPCPDCAARRKDADSQPTRAFYFKYAIQPADMNEIAATLRQLLPQDDRTMVIPSQNAIIIRAIPEDMSLAEKIIDDLDRPKKSWRITYTLTEMDGDKRVGTQHYSLVAVSTQQAVLKEGDRVPIAVGAYASAGKDTNQTNFTYQDIGMTFEATLTQIPEGARLRSDVVRTSLADEKSGFGAQDPVFRQAEIKSEAVLTPGKPLVLGTMDMPGSTHHLQVEALIEPLP